MPSHRGFAGTAIVRACLVTGAGRNDRRGEQYISRVLLARMVWIEIRSALGFAPAGLAVDAQGEAERLA